MKRCRAIILLIASALALGACQRSAENGITEISGRMFVFNYRVSAATYMITLARKAPLPENGRVETQYENPAGGAPIVAVSTIYPFWEKIVLESPPVHCIVKDRPYAVKIRILDARGKPVQALETTVVSNIDQTVLAARPLVVGPAYDRNPALRKGDGTTDYAPETGCPA